MQTLPEICKFLWANSITGKPAKLFNRGRSQTKVPCLPSWDYDCLILNLLDLPLTHPQSSLIISIQRGRLEWAL